MYVVTLYVEGGPSDGETFTVGTFVLEKDAAECAERLSPLGQTAYHFLYATAAAVEHAL